MAEEENECEAHSLPSGWEEFRWTSTAGDFVYFLGWGNSGKLDFIPWDNFVNWE